MRYCNSIISYAFQNQDSWCRGEKKYVIKKKLGKNPEVLNLSWKYQLEFMKYFIYPQNGLDTVIIPIAICIPGQRGLVRPSPI